jgi:hypothetical protein
MRREARAVLDATPGARQDQMRSLIRQLLGPTALEDPDEEDDLDDEDLADEGEGGDDLTLGGGSGFQLSSPTLGGGSGSGLTLHDAEGDAEGTGEDDEEAGDEGPALMLGDRSHFHLGGDHGTTGGGDSLHLDMH